MTGAISAKEHRLSIKTVCKKKKRSFRAAWFDLYPWLELHTTAEAAFCHTCRMAVQLKMISFAHCADDAFTQTGV